jgi:hypothetical protein
MDISTDLTGEDGNGRQEAARKQVALDLRKPEFDLVEHDE